MEPSRRSLLLDAEALNQADKPLEREHQLRELRGCFTSPANASPINAWAHGPPGTGKTSCIQHLLGSLPKGTAGFLINCRERFTLFSVLEQILDVLRPLRPAHRTRESELTALRKILEDRPAVIALDEVDVLPPKDRHDLLYHLTALPRASVLCVCPSRLTLLRLPDAVKSRLAPRQVLFPRYTNEELSAILRHIASHALVPGALDKNTLKLIVNHSYGDARRASALLRHAVQRADEAGAPRLLPGHLKLQNFEHFNAEVEDELNTLTAHHRMFYDLVARRGPVAGGRLEEWYRRACRRQKLEQVSPRTVTKYLGMLCDRRILCRDRGPGTPGWIYSVK